MFASVAADIKERVKQLEARLARLESERDDLDARLASLQVGGNAVGPASEPLKFVPLSSKADAEFFRELGTLKLNHFKLSDDPIDIWATYSVTNGKEQPKSWMEIRATSFRINDDPAEVLFAHERRACGRLLNVNTTEKFKEIDKRQLLQDSTTQMLEDFKSGFVFEKPSTCLARFVLLTFADLKKHRYLYWFAFPTLGYINGDEPQVISRSDNMAEVLPGYFERLSAFELNEDVEKSFFFFDMSGDPRPFRDLPSHRKNVSSLVFGFVDPSPSSAHPSWLMRNLIAFLIDKDGMDLSGQVVRIVAVRDVVTAAPRPPSNCVVYVIQLPNNLDKSVAVGWEHNEQNKLGPRMVDLSAMLDETKLLEAACNLNLSLMKWRAFPELDDGKLASTKVLLLGAGTLGCAVARGLLGWGFRSMTFCDSGKVSYSNPVRQSLFVAADCHGTGRHKAEAAAEMCLKIHPGLNVSSWVGNIPMPGHSGDPRAYQDFSKLEELVRSHDVICLLTDTRESRWLPTVLGAAFDKLVLNAALGFDSFMVMRHGSIHQDYAERLGCYFCSDVVAPQDSTKDRSLDQQCTVTRPGCAPVAAALLVEMMVSILHHTQGNLARPKDAAQNKLGVIPHQVRGYLGSFQNDLITGQAFPQCSACSEHVVNAYKKDGFGFISKVLEDPNFLEALTGLDKLKGSGEVNDVDFEALDFEMDDDDEQVGYVGDSFSEGEEI